MPRPRLYLDLSESEKERFQSAVGALGSNMTAVIRAFVAQWSEQQEKVTSVSPRFFVICLEEELHRKVINRMQDDNTSINQVVNGYLERYVGAEEIA